MKNTVFLSGLTILAIPMVLSAWSHSYQRKSEKPTVSKQNTETSSSMDSFERICNPTRWSLDIRGTAFIPLKKQHREIYGSGLPTLQFESSYCLTKNLWASCDRLLLWENVSWSSKTGKSIGFSYHSKLNLIPISLGLEYQVNMGCNFDFYVGLGPTYSFLRIENKDGFRTTHLNRNQFGLTTKTGFRYTFFTNFFIDVFGDYYYTQFRKMKKDHIQNVQSHFSGFFVGGGFGGKW